MKRKTSSPIKTLIFLIMALLEAVSLGALDTPEPEIAVSAQLSTSRNGVVTAVVAFPKGYHQVHEPDFFTVKVTAPEGIVSGTVNYPEGIDYNGETAYYGATRISVPFTLNKNLEAGETLTVEIRWQLCSEEGTCFRPAKREITVVPETPPAGTAKNEGSLIFLYILFAFLGGILLNIMPCVLPILSIKAMGIVRQGGEDRKSILAQALAYSLGIILSFVALALLVILLKASGKALGWGFQFQNIPFVIVLTTITFLFTLSLFGVFEVLPPRIAGEGSTRAQRRGGLTGSLLTGLLAVLLATPCTAPFLGAAMGFAFTQPAPVILGLFLATGTGFALPFLLLGFNPGILKRLPKPGPWMEIFKKMMGFVLAGTTVHLLDVLYKQTGQGIISILWFLLTGGVSAAIWGWGVRPDRSRRKRVIAAIVALLVLAGGGLAFLGDLDSQPDYRNTEITPDNRQEIPFSEQALNQLVADNRIVFVHFTADWCLTCKSNEKTVLSTKRIKTLFEEQNIVVLKGDLTREDPVLLSFLQKNGRAGVPFYQVYRPGEEPVTLPEILTPGILEQAIGR